MIVSQVQKSGCPSISCFQRHPPQTQSKSCSSLPAAQYHKLFANSTSKEAKPIFFVAPPVVQAATGKSTFPSRSWALSFTPSQIKIWAALDSTQKSLIL